MVLRIGKTRVSVLDLPLTALETLGTLFTSHAQSKDEPSCPCWVPGIECPGSAPLALQL